MEDRGQPIPGSNLFRDYCAVCGEPIRVTEEKRELPRNYCIDCMRTAVHKLAETVQKAERERNGSSVNGEALDGSGELNALEDDDLDD